MVERASSHSSSKTSTRSVAGSSRFIGFHFGDEPVGVVAVDEHFGRLACLFADDAEDAHGADRSRRGGACLDVRSGRGRFGPDVAAQDDGAALKPDALCPFCAHETG